MLTQLTKGGVVVGDGGTLRGSRVNHGLKEVGTMRINKEERKEGSMFEHAAVSALSEHC